MASTGPVHNGGGTESAGLVVAASILRPPLPTRQAVSRAIKRLIDVAVSSLSLLILAPLLLTVSLASRMTLGRPVLFRQVRPGYKGKPFTLYKFRTMREAYSSDGTPRPDAERLTRLGRLLRHTSLDELPQLWNVLRGT